MKEGDEGWADKGWKPELYTFAQYLKDTGVCETVNEPLKKYLILWDLEKEHYRVYCKTGGVEPEDFDLLLSIHSGRKSPLPSEKPEE